MGWVGGGPCDFSVSPRSQSFFFSFFGGLLFYLGLGQGLGLGLGPGLDNKSLCVSLNPPLKESRLIRKNSRASYFIDVFVLLYFVHTCLDLYSMFVFDSVKRPTIKLDKTQKGELWTLVVKKHASDCKLCVDLRSESGVQ